MRLCRFNGGRLGVADGDTVPGQRADTRDLLIDLPGLVELATRFCTLRRGDKIAAAITGIGTVGFAVRAA